MAFYIETEVYRRLVAALADVRPDYNGDLPDGIKLALGEIGDIWPDSIESDVVGDETVLRRPAAV